ncbi:MAG: hypothetical protein EXS17_04825 [Phycisphaerales bacterium]|nr:hypothetical protein [Phycisphaerales bacterium]
MMFTSPILALAGVLAIAIPVALHFFFRRRHQPIPWAAMHLLRIAITQTTRRKKIDRIILLLLRSLVVALAGLAIAGPLRKNPTGQPQVTDGAPQELVIILDDGVSQQTTDQAGEAFAVSKEQALAAIDKLQERDAVGVILAAGAQPLVWPPSRDLAAARSTVESSSVSSAPSDIAAALELTQINRRTVGVLSAFRRGSLADTVDNNTTQTGTKVVVTPPNQNDVTNVQLVTCEPQARGPSSSRGGIPLRLRLMREGDSLLPSVSNIDIALDDGAHTSLRVEWKDGQTENIVESVIVAAATRRTDVPLRATLVDQDSQMADNVRFAVVTTASTIQVGVIDRMNNESTEHGVGAWVNHALSPTEDGDIEVETIDPTSIDTKRCQGLDAIVVIRPDLIDTTGWSLLAQLIHNGKVLIVIPPAQPSTSGWSDKLLQAINLGWTIAREPTTSDPALTITQTIASGDGVADLLRQLAPELQDLTQPVTVNRWFEITIPAGRGESVLGLSSGSPLIAQGSPESARGSVIVLATPPDLNWTNLPAKPLMVPLFQECVRQAITQADRHRGTTVGSDHIPITLASTTSLQLVIGRLGEATEATRVLSVGPNGSLATPILTPGVYVGLDATGHPTGHIVANIDVAAASTKRTTIDEVTNQFKGASLTVSTTNFSNNDPSAALNALQQPQAKALDGHSLAIWFFGAVIALVLVETWMARRSSVGATTQIPVSAAR